MVSRSGSTYTPAGNFEVAKLLLYRPKTTSRDSEQTSERIGGGRVVMWDLLMLRFRGMILGPGRAASQILRRSSVGRSLKHVNEVMTIECWIVSKSFT